jgi:hypothetical protein
MDNQIEKKIPKWKEERIDARIFNAESRMFAGDLPTRMVKNGEKLSFQTVKGNDLPMVERIQNGYLYEGTNDFIWQTTTRHTKPGFMPEKTVLYKFRKVASRQLDIYYRKNRNKLNLYFASMSKRDAYYDELINKRRILNRENKVIF